MKGITAAILCFVVLYGLSRCDTEGKPVSYAVGCLIFAAMFLTLFIFSVVTLFL